MVLEAYAQEQVLGTDAALVLRAIRLAQAHGLSHWDALIVQAAIDGGCKWLYSEDLQAGRRFGTLEVVNPFAVQVNEPAGHCAPADPTPVGKPKRRPARKARRR